MLMSYRLSGSRTDLTGASANCMLFCSCRSVRSTSTCFELFLLGCWSALVGRELDEELVLLCCIMLLFVGIGSVGALGCFLLDVVASVEVSVCYI